MWEFHAGVVLENNYHQSFILHIFITRRMEELEGWVVVVEKHIHVIWIHTVKWNEAKKVQRKMTVFLSSFVGNNCQWLLCEKDTDKNVSLFVTPNECNSCSFQHTCGDYKRSLVFVPLQLLSINSNWEVEENYFYICFWPFVCAEFDTVSLSNWIQLYLQ